MLSFATAGRGPLLVLLHGGALDRRMWRDQVPALSATYRVVTPDLRGHGQSPTPTLAFRHCDDVAELLRDLGEPAVLAGVSLGAGAAVDTAIAYPELVRGVVVTGAGTSESDFDDPWLLDILQRLAEAATALNPAAWTETYLEFAAGPHRCVADVDEDVIERCRTMITDTLRAHVSDRPPVLPEPLPDSWSRIGRITVPVLAINGALDSSDHLRLAERLISGVPRGRSAIVADSAHYPNMEHPAAYNAQLLDFLDEVPWRAP